MATGTQVPFTDPGGTPCCCGSNCFDASGNTVPDYATNVTPVPLQNSWFNITDTEFDALKAGGTYAADLNLFLKSFRESSASCAGSGGWVKRKCNRELSANVTNQALTITAPNIVNGKPASSDEKCMMIMEKTDLTINEYDWRPAFACGTATNTNSSFTTRLGFSRILGKSGSQSKLSCCSHNNTNPAAGSGWRDWLFFFSDGNGCGSNSAPIIYLVSGNVNGTIATGVTAQPYMQPLSNITLSVKIQINGGTEYTIPNVYVVGYSSNSGVRTQFFNGTSITCGGTTCSGGFDPTSAITYVVRFTSSPP